MASVAFSGPVTSVNMISICKSDKSGELSQVHKNEGRTCFHAIDGDIFALLLVAFRDNGRDAAENQLQSAMFHIKGQWIHLSVTYEQQALLYFDMSAAQWEDRVPVSR